MKEIKLNLENLTDAEREQLMDLVEKANKSKSKVWKPERGDKYWCIGWAGAVLSDKWLNKIDDKEAYAIGNCFRTEEEIKEEITRRKMLKRWKDLSIESGEDDNPWDGNSLHWYAYLDYFHGECLACFGSKYDRYDITYFPTRKACEEAIKELGKENVKKYILGVKE